MGSASHWVRLLINRGVGVLGLGYGFFMTGSVFVTINNQDGEGKAVDTYSVVRGIKFDIPSAG